MTTRDRLIALIANHAGFDVASVGPLNTLANDLDLDSLDRIELGMAIEQTFHIPITDADLDRPELGTVGGLLAFVEDRYEPHPLLAQTFPPRTTVKFRRPAPVSGMEALSRLAQEADRSAEHLLRAAFDAGWEARNRPWRHCGQLEIDSAWERYKASVGL